MTQPACAETEDKLQVFERIPKFEEVVPAYSYYLRLHFTCKRPLIESMTAPVAGLWLAQTPKPRTIRKCKAKNLSKPLIFRALEMKLTPPFCVVGVGILKNAYDNLLNNVSRYAGSGLRYLSCICVEISLSLRKVCPLVWLKIFMYFLSHCRYPPTGFLFLHHTLILPVVSSSQYT